MPLFSLFKVFGHSMEPTLLNGSKVLVSSLPFLIRDPGINDIIAFADKTSGKIFVKRITKRKGQRYFLTGDNKHDSLDSKVIGWISKKDIVGKVIFKI